MRTIPVIIEFDPDTKTFGATSPDLPDVYAVSDTRDDVLERFAYSANAYVEFLKEQNEPLPPFSTCHEVVKIEIPACELAT